MPQTSSKQNRKAFANSAVIMKHHIQVPSFGINDKRQPPPSLRNVKDVASEGPTLSVSHIKKRTSSRLHRSLVVQVSVFFVTFFFKNYFDLVQPFSRNDIHSENMIHTNIRASRNNVTSVGYKQNNPNEHLLQSVRIFKNSSLILSNSSYLNQTVSVVSISHIRNELEENMVTPRAVKLVKNKIKPLGVSKSDQYRALPNKVSTFDSYLTTQVISFAYTSVKFHYDTVFFIKTESYCVGSSYFLVMLGT